MSQTDSTLRGSQSPTHRNLRTGLLILACWIGTGCGCDSNPTAPTAVAPDPEPAASAAKRVKPQDPFISRD